MSYIIYKNVTESEFTELKTRLNDIETISSAIMKISGFTLSDKYYPDVLALDYTCEDDIFLGNIGVSFNDEKSYKEKLFSFYVLKAYDKSGKRFVKNEELPKLYSIYEVEKNFIEEFQNCILKYNSWKIVDLVEFIDLP